MSNLKELKEFIDMLVEEYPDMIESPITIATKEHLNAENEEVREFITMMAYENNTWVIH